MIEWKISREPVDYQYAITQMEERVKHIRENNAKELIWLLEHNPIYTAGSSAKDADLLNHNLPVYKTGRGGQYTYHGNGQRIAYVMLDIKKRGGDIRSFVKQLENWIIKTLAEFGIKGEIREGRVGVWVQNGNSEEKIAAIGIRVKNWVSYHGISININPDLSHYNGIIPCGIKEYGVTSLAKLGVNISMEEFDKELINTFNATSLY